MKLERGLQSTHNLKKSTYRMLRKLHCFESRGAMRDSQRIGRDYCILIFLKHKLKAPSAKYYEENSTGKEVLKHTVSAKSGLYSPYNY